MTYTEDWCKYSAKGCDMVGQVGDISILTREFYLSVCMVGSVAKKKCPCYQVLNKAEGISRRLGEITEEVSDLAGRLKPYELKE